jgi:hypothetical protein
VINVGADATADTVSCGSGLDTVVYSAKDSVASDCERKIRVAS